MDVTATQSRADRASGGEADSFAKGGVDGRSGIFWIKKELGFRLGYVKQGLDNGGRRSVSTRGEFNSIRSWDGGIKGSRVDVSQESDGARLIGFFFIRSSLSSPVGGIG